MERGKEITNKGPQVDVASCIMCSYSPMLVLDVEKVRVCRDL